MFEQSSCAATRTDRTSLDDLGKLVARFYAVLDRMADLHHVYKVTSLAFPPPSCHGGRPHEANHFHVFWEPGLSESKVTWLCCRRAHMKFLASMPQA